MVSGRCVAAAGVSCGVSVEGGEFDGGGNIFVKSRGARGDAGGEGDDWPRSAGRRQRRSVATAGWIAVSGQCASLSLQPLLRRAASMGSERRRGAPPGRPGRATQQRCWAADRYVGPKGVGSLPWSLGRRSVG